MDAHPHDLDLAETVSAIAHTLDDACIPFEIDDDGAVRAVCSGSWTDFDVWFVHNSEIQALHVCATLRSVEADGLALLAETIGYLNERLWLGHLEMWRDPGEIVWRYTLPLPIGSDGGHDQITAILQGVKDAADRTTPVCDLVVRGLCTPHEAVNNQIFETMGEA